MRTKKTTIDSSSPSATPAAKPRQIVVAKTSATTPRLSQRSRERSPAHHCASRRLLQLSISFSAMTSMVPASTGSGSADSSGRPCR